MTGPVGRVSEPVRLAWVLADGALHPVDAFVGVPARARPRAVCPLCGDAVILKLGRLIAPHAAHRPDADCLLTNEETALHFNTKHHLAAALRVVAGTPGAALHVRQRCTHRGGVLGDTLWTPGLVPCPALREETLVDGWDEVRVEATLSDVRPDVLLLAGGVPLAAIEVRRTHALTAAKLERFAAVSLPWIEVVASRTLYAEFSAWRIDTPLTALRTHACAPWTCEVHRHEARRPGGSAYGAPTVAAIVARVVDRYRPDGRVVREVVYLDALARQQTLTAPVLRLRGAPVPLAVLRDGPREAVLRAAHAAFRAWAAGRRALGEQVDSPMSWLDAARMRADDGGLTAPAVFPRRLAFDRVAGCWQPRPGVGERPWVLAATLGRAAAVRERRPEVPPAPVCTRTPR